MGYRSEVSIIVGKKVDAKIQTLVKTIEKEVADGKTPESALTNLTAFLAGKTTTADGKFIRYYNDYMKWYTTAFDEEYRGLSRFESLILEAAEEPYTDDTAASFIRIGEEMDDREEHGNDCGDLQTIGIIVGKPFK